jgi:hypothetical protein
MPPTRPRRTPARKAADQPAAREDADQAQTEAAEAEQAGSRTLSRSEQAALRRKLREKFH